MVGAAPFVASQALLARGDTLRGALVRGILPDEEARITELAAKLRDTALARCSRARRASCSVPSWRASWACGAATW